MKFKNFENFLTVFCLKEAIKAVEKYKNGSAKKFFKDDWYKGEKNKELYEEYNNALGLFYAKRNKELETRLKLF